MGFISELTQTLIYCSRSLFQVAKKGELFIYEINWYIKTVETDAANNL